MHVGRHFPDKAIDLIDESCATTRMQVAAKQKTLNSSRQTDLGNKAKLVVCPEHVAQVGIISHTLCLFV
jgi:ATP-dependent Clp protease ATP-binding subunit ClpA